VVLVVVVVVVVVVVLGWDGYLSLKSNHNLTYCSLT
jgi:Tfp pilus assembly protein PilO